ncbi:hypothetical protein LAZ40_09640 [Cereibacter sphaeroides]|uniref:hypothetical protein n=1 Tax=Cereibacter sphaeroides TaxID=1063 RepID=UPI001F2D07C2|nr:hypothetical protein [Cereibacter sphaeroides]MCE6959312.1 hypothetical protein [Cereibacter sphaeroides]MCE6972904.1 hypothetical protein [Cereibacter sphaeroides]
MTAQTNLVQIIPGKAGTSGEGHTFITNRDHETGARAIIVEAGAVKAGGKGDLSLWRLPEGWAKEAIDALRWAAEQAAREDLAAKAAADIGPGASGASEAVAAECEARSAPDEAAAAMKEAASAAPEAAEANTAASRSGALEIEGHHGYALGMSIAERDKYRLPVKPGSVKVGDLVEVDGGTREIVLVGAPFHVAADLVEDMRLRFPEADGIQRDAVVQFVMWRPEPGLGRKNALPEAVPQPRDEAEAVEPDAAPAP